jgi:hypothetical protein
MFRRIVSNLPFSPALVGQLGFYAKRLHKEEVTRQLGLIFLVLALLVQSLSIFQPPESANASGLNDTFSSNNIEVFYNENTCPNNVSSLLCTNSIINKSETAINASQGFINASSAIAHANDQIIFTINIKNTSPKIISVELKDSLVDALEYATLIDNGGGTFDQTMNMLSWPNITLSPNAQQTRVFIIKLLDTIPATARGSKISTSYDCIIGNTFGNSININIDCPAPKIIERITTELPTIGQSTDIIFAVIVLSMASYFYTRTRQLKKEISLMRKDINAGII